MVQAGHRDLEITEAWETLTGWTMRLEVRAQGRPARRVRVGGIRPAACGEQGPLGAHTCGRTWEMQQQAHNGASAENGAHCPARSPVSNARHHSTSVVERKVSLSRNAQHQQTTSKCERTTSLNIERSGKRVDFGGPSLSVSSPKWISTRSLSALPLHFPALPPVLITMPLGSRAQPGVPPTLCRGEHRAKQQEQKTQK